MGIVSLIISVILYNLQDQLVLYHFKSFFFKSARQKKQIVYLKLWFHLFSSVQEIIVNKPFILFERSLNWTYSSWRVYSINILFRYCGLYINPIAFKLFKSRSFKKISNSTIKASSKNNSLGCFSRKVFNVIVIQNFLKNIVIKFLTLICTD